MEYQQIIFLAWPVSWCPGVSTVVARFVCVVAWKASGVLGSGVVFGALLGPEATGPFCSDAGFLGVSCCSLQLVPGFCVCARGRVWLTGLLFENYIVDASI